MTPFSTLCLSLVAAMLVVGGFGAKLSEPSPMEGFHSANLPLDPLFTAHSRQTRSATGGVPCVSVYFLNELKERFIRWMDHNNDGRSTFDEVRNYLRRFKPNVPNETVTAFIGRRDSNGNGDIDFVPEYVEDLSAPDYSLAGATEWFNLQDTNDDGFVTEQELMQVATAIGMSPQEALNTVRGYYMTADQNGDSKLSFDEFKTLYHQ
uniref:Calmodulin-like protein n=1 Tax=Onchidium reevesii TaxID=2547651 RepID=A0A6B9IMH7_9EUPU|nr:calmodulin-like protein [Onchidium reevesii]